MRGLAAPGGRSPGAAIATAVPTKGDPTAAIGMAPFHRALNEPGVASPSCVAPPRLQMRQVVVEAAPPTSPRFGARSVWWWIMRQRPFSRRNALVKRCRVGTRSPSTMLWPSSTPNA